MSNRPFIGTWSLISYTVCVEGSQKEFFPYGKHPVGFLIYTDLDVSVHIMKSPRLQKSACTEEKIEIAENYGGYVGHYEVQGDIVIHYPKVSSFIEFLSGPQERNFKLEVDNLILSNPVVVDEKKKNAQAQLIWKRLKK